MQKLNVLSIVSYNFLPAKMGGQKGIALWNSFFSRLVNLHCLTVQSNQQQFASYKLHNSLSNSASRYFNPFIFFKARKIIKAHAITHVIIEHPYYGWLAFLLKKTLKVKIIVHSHNIESLRFKSVNKWWWKILWHYEKWVHQLAHQSFFISNQDMHYAIKHFKLNKQICCVITYGFDLKSPPTSDEKNEARQLISQYYDITKTEKILLFNGTLSYAPNLQAIDDILQHINPILLSNTNFKYKIIICGKGLPNSYNNLIDYRSKNIAFAGFVDDITIFYKAADIFINPVVEGGGIKTKIVEALGYNVSLVTTQSGAIGIDEEITGNKMKIIDDGKWTEFAEKIMNIDVSASIPLAYYQHFYWEHIAAKGFAAIKSL